MIRLLTLVLLCAVIALPASAQNDDIFSDTAAVVLEGTPPPVPPRGLLDEIRARDTLRVGISTYMPWAMYTSDGELVGYEVDVAERLAEDLGVRLQLVPNSPASMISDLLQGDYDVIVSGMNITPQRALQVDFTHPYGYSDIAVVANRSQATNRMAAGDFNDPGVTIGVRNDATSEELVAAEMPQATVLTFEDDLSLLEALRSGRVGAAVTYSPLPEFAVQEFPDELMIPEGGILARRPEGIAVRKGNQSLLNYLNAWTSYYETDPWMRSRRAYWFRSDDWLGMIAPDEASDD